MAAKVGDSRSEQRPAAVEVDEAFLATVAVPLLLEGGIRALRRLHPADTGDAEQDVSRLARAQPPLGQPVAV